MNLRNRLVCAAAGAILGPLAAAPAPGADARRSPTPGPLRAHPDNPGWFATPDGRAVWLTGSHTWAGFQERGVEGQTPDFDFPRYLDFLERHGHNFIRLWVWEHAQWMQFTDAPVRYKPLAYARTGPGVALDGQPKFDLTKLNDEFFVRLRGRVEAARERGFYVSVMLFQGFSVRKKPTQPGAGNNWRGNPFNKANNVNGIDGNPSGDDTGNESHTLAVPAIVRIQEAYVRRMVDTVNDLDNVLWEIGNELHESSVEWQNHMIRFIRDCERSTPNRHLIGMTGAPIKTADLMASEADWISPPGKAWLRDPPAADGRKIVVVDNDHGTPMDHSPSWVWKALTRGHHFLLMDGYMDVRTGTSPQPLPAWDTTRDAMGAARRLTERLELARMKPAPPLASSGFCLADPGRAWLVYCPAEQQSVTVATGPGRFAAAWLDPVSGREVARAAVEASAGELVLQSPTPGDHALLVSAPSAAASTTPLARTHSVFALKPDHTGALLNGRPFLAIGLRLSNGLISEAKTDELIANLDTFAGYGVNTVSVFFQGSRFGDVCGYRQDATLDPVYAGRMSRIIEAADARGMVVLVGCLYHGGSKGWWPDWKQADAERAIANTMRWLAERDYRNVFIDVNNEHMAKFDDAALIAAGKAVDARYVIAASGKDTPPNADLSIHLGGPNAPGKYYIETEGTGGGYWGSYSKQPGLYDYINIGVYTDELKALMLERTDAHLDRGDGYLFASTWLQNPPPAGPHHTPGGLGTPDDPGVRWWLEHVKTRVGPYRLALDR